MTEPPTDTISLATLPSDIIRMIIPLGGQSRHMRARWNTQVLQFLNRKRPILSFSIYSTPGKIYMEIKIVMKILEHDIDYFNVGNCYIEALYDTYKGQNLVEVMTRWHIVTDSKAKCSTFPIYVISRFASLHGIYRAVGRIRNILPRQEARTTQAKFRKIFESSSNIAELKIVGLPLFAFDDFRSCLRSVRIERLAVW
ncbi:hypothetical protein PRIPAC_79263, partial [Pristionchus pacificus]|uniref:Uncharacterized protein n=1 Tax=Pristionchus pacificus TaxID=54126 RepID=A0A2A6BX02_PRIPA